MRVLIIDDNRSNLELSVYLLTAFGHTTVATDCAKNGLREALRGAFDLVLADIKLPDADGFQLAGKLKQILGKIPIVALTAMAMAGDRNLALAAGFDDYIVKPIDPIEFVPTLERIQASRSLARASARSTSQLMPSV
ncbi:MAG: response regulator [Candidatus Eremiobacteraeota bacterium]|nr:response regulator [Candidatus Eremiobacteraeota bacterium]